MSIFHGFPAANIFLAVAVVPVYVCMRVCERESNTELFQFWFVCNVCKSVYINSSFELCVCLKSTILCTYMMRMYTDMYISCGGDQT